MPRKCKGFFSKQFLLKGLGSNQGSNQFSLLFKSQFYSRTNAFFIFELKQPYDREETVEQRPVLVLCEDNLDTIVDNTVEKQSNRFGQVQCKK